MIFKKENLKFLYDIARDYKRSFLADGVCLAKKLFSPSEKPARERVFINRLYFEITNICNSRCRYCLYSKKPPQRLGVMKFDVFKKAIDEFGKAGGKAVSFTPTIGEPLLDEGLMDKIRYALKVLGIEQVYFYTNGTLLLKNENYKKLIESGIHKIEISLTACDEKIFKKLQGIDAYDATLEGIQKLLQYNKIKGERTVIGINFRSPVLPSKVLASSDFQRYIKPFLSPQVSYSFMAVYDNWCGNITKNDLSGVMRLGRVNRFKYLPCRRTYDAAILFDGSVRLCACRIKDSEFDDLVVGSIKNNSLEEIFYSEKAKKIRNSFFSGTVPVVCENCSLYVPATKKFLNEREKKNLRRWN